MNAAEVRSALAECTRLPEGRPKAQRLESLAAEVRQAGDAPLEAEVLLALSRAYEYSAERERMAVPFGRLLQLLDRFPAELGPMSWTIHWQLKWMIVGLIRNPAVPLETAQRWLDELDHRFRERGFSPRPVHMLRWLLAQGRGDEAAATAEVDAWIASPRDRMADCEACERNDWGTWRAFLGDDAGALGYWAPLLAGQRRCAEEPHRVLAKALLPLVRTGQLADARDAFLRGYPLARHNVSLCAAVGGHIEFCALTGNEARGLEILAEHAAWLTDTQLDTADRLSFLTGVGVLLRRLAALGHGDLPVGAGTVAGTASALEAEVRELCSRYDARNRNMAVSGRVAAQLAQAPLVDRLPLGLPARLPAALSSPPPLPEPPAETLDDLVAEARRLSAARHPHARRAWAEVAAAGQDLPPDVAARLARSQAGALLPGDPKAAYPALLAVAAQFARLGDLARTYEARGSAAIAQALAGQPEEGAAAAALVIAESGVALAAGTLTPGEHLAVRVAEPAIALERLAAAPERAPADVADAVRVVTAALAMAEQAAEPRYAATFHEMLAQLAAWQGEADALALHLDAARGCYLEASEPWRAAVPEGTLGQLALQRADPAAAETHAREALAHGGGLLEPGPAAQLVSLLAEATGAQPGRERDSVDASLAAAAAWEGLSEPDTLHHTFTAARAYLRLGQHAEAVALFAEAMPRVHIPYVPPAIAVTREQYGRALAETGRQAEAAREFLEAARLVQDDADQTMHARLARAAADALRRAGQRAEALAAYQRAGQLFGELGDVTERVRSLRSAAWLEFGAGPGAASQAEPDAGTTDAGAADAGAADAEPPDAGPPGVATMRAVLSELEALAADGSSPELDTELAATREQLDQMLSPPEEDDESDLPGPARLAVSGVQPTLTVARMPPATL